MSPDGSRAILHVDMDAFFAAIAVLERPELRGKPVLTGGTGPRSVVTTASYEARKFGCRSAMPMATARRLCPQAIVVQVKRETIRRYSHQLFELLHDVTPVVEPISVDEAFLDVTGTDRLHGEPVAIATKLKQRIFDELKLTASVGVSFNKYLAKLASDMDKPDGLTVIRPNDVDRVLPPLDIDKLWGVGPRTATRLRQAGIHRISDVRRYSLEQLHQRFGEVGEHLHRLAHGIDTRHVIPDHQAKSIGHEQTFPQDVADRAALRAVLLGQVEQVARRLRRQQLQTRGLTLKLRFGEFQTITRSTTLPAPTDLTDELWQAAQALFDAWSRQRFEPLRLIGVSADRLTRPSEQLPLFIDINQQRRRQLDQTLDRITDRFGPGAIGRGAGDARDTRQRDPHNRQRPDWYE